MNFFYRFELVELLLDFFLFLSPEPRQICVHDENINLLSFAGMGSEVSTF